jgi:hypothetical protein
MTIITTTTPAAIKVKLLPDAAVVLDVITELLVTTVGLVELMVDEPVEVFDDCEEAVAEVCETVPVAEVVPELLVVTVPDP